MSKAFRELLDKRFKKLLTDEEFQFECACGAMESVGELRFAPLPQKPQVLWDFERQKNDPSFKRMESAERAAITKKVLEKDEVKKFYDDTVRRTYQNKSNAEWLEHLIKVFVKHGDKVFAGKVWDIYKDYPDALYLQDETIWKKKKDF
jgi:hypothetical protein